MGTNENIKRSELKHKALGSFVWQFLQKIFGQLFSFIVTIILARLLLPSDYGVVALASMFNVLVGIFVSGSMDAALIQKKDADELDYNTVFYSSLFMSFVIYSLVFFGAPIIANIYGNPLVTPVMRVLALTMPIGALAMVQNATVSKQLQFKKFFYASLVGQIISSATGIVMAYSGFGAWALVAQSMIGCISNTVVMFFLVSWHPKLMFSFARFKELFNYAWKKTAAGFIGTLCDQLKGYLIGYKYTMADLAFFNRGEGLPDMFRNNISGTINAVLFPALSQVSDDPQVVKRGIRRAMMTSSYILCPIFLGLGAVSDQIVPLLYSERWLPAIPFMKVACLTSCVIVLNNANLQSIFAIGKSGEVLKLEFYKKPVMTGILFVAVFISPLAISIGMFFYSLYVLYMNTKPNKKFLGYSLKEQVNDIKGGLLLSLLMAIIVFAIGQFITNLYISLAIQIIFGVCFYIGLSEWLKLEAYVNVKQTFLGIIHEKMKKHENKA